MPMDLARYNTTVIDLHLYSMFKQLLKLTTSYNKLPKPIRIIPVAGLLLALVYYLPFNRGRRPISSSGANVTNPQPSIQDTTPQPAKLPLIRKNVLQVPSTLPEETLELLGDIYPDFEIRLADSLQGRVVCFNTNGKCKEVQLKQDHLIQNNWMHELSNFNVPPHIATQESLEKVLKGVTESQNVVITYLPEGQFSALEVEYRQLKEQSTSSSNTYLLVREKQLADSLELMPGNLYILNKRDIAPDNKYKVLGEPFRKEYLSSYQKIEAKRKFIGDNTLEPVNMVYSQIQLDNFIRTVRASSSQLVMATSLDSIGNKDLDNIKKMLGLFKKQLKTEVHLLISKTKGLLSRKFRIEEDKMGIDVRVLNLKEVQPVEDLFKGYSLEGVHLNQVSKVVSRRKYEDALKGEDFQNFMKSSQEHYEQKHLKNLKPLIKIPSDIEGLVLVFKNECPGCLMVGKIFENIQQIIQEIQHNGPRSQEFIQQNNITNVQKFKQLKLYRFHVLNEDTSFPLDVSYTPQIHYLSPKGDKVISLKEESKMNEVHLQIINQVCEEFS